MCEPDLILPSQHFRQPEKLAPEHRLMIAVLDDAIRCVERNRVSTDMHGQRAFREAQQWLLAQEPNWPYSFERICAVLDLDANAVRFRLLFAPQRQAAAAARQSALAEHGCSASVSATTARANLGQIF